MSPRVAVVGASAAGLAAALSAARAGAAVTLYEARAEVGVPAAPAIVAFDHLWPATVGQAPQAVRRRLRGVKLRASDGRGPSIDAPLTLFDRTKLDARLAAEAEGAGARIVTGAKPGAWESEDARVVIFADGANTEARRFLQPTRDPDNLAWGAVLEFEAPGEPEELLLTLGPHAPGGRSQLNPLGGGRWSHWTFFRGDRSRAEDLARRALRLDAALQGWRDPELSARFAGVAPDPVYTLPGQLATERVMVVGGAAGQGGLEAGLGAGWMAGEVAARVVRGEAKPVEYERAWKADHQRGFERLRRATDALAHLTDAETRRLLGAWDGARLPARPRARDALARPRGALALAWAAWLAHARG